MKQRTTCELATTDALADIVASVYRRKHAASRSQRAEGAFQLHPATRTMQALRVLVNNELCDMEQALTAALPHVRIGGRVAVLCFQPDEASVRQKVFARVRPAPATPQHRTRGEDKGTGAARAAGGKRGEQEHPAPEPSQQHTHGKGQAAGVGLHATNERRWRVRRVRRVRRRICPHRVPWLLDWRGGCHVTEPRLCVPVSPMLAPL